MAGLQRLLIQHIAHVGFGRAAVGTDLSGHLFSGCLVQVQHGHFGAAGRQSLGKHAAEDPAGAGDHGDLAAEINL